MDMPSVALLVKLSGNALAARHDPGRFLDKAHFASWAINVRHHPELAHVALDNVNCGMSQQLVDALQLPGSGRPWMLMEKMPASFNLILVQGAAELDMLDRLSVSLSNFSSHPGLLPCTDLLSS